MTRHETQVWHWRLDSFKQLPDCQQRNEDLELYKTDIRVSKENQERDNTEHTQRHHTVLSPSIGPREAAEKGERNTRRTGTN